MSKRIWTFFYGSYINFDVLAEVDLRPENYETASLAGFDISIKPLANLQRSIRHAVFGIVAKTSHAELDRLYKHAETVLGGVYLPEAVVVSTMDGKLVPALCYISPNMATKQADPAYVDRIAGPAKEFGFPSWYIERIESFRDLV